MRNEKLKQDFIQYMADHPDERFWQSVRNFSGWSFVYVSDGLIGDNEPGKVTRVEDTFYWEGRSGYDEERQDPAGSDIQPSSG